MKANVDGFSYLNLQISDAEKYPEISKDIQATLARLLGFDPNNKRFNLLLCDSDGRLLVSSSASTGASATNSAASVGVASVQLLAANASRKSAYIYNNAGATIYLMYGVPATLALGFPIPAGGAFIEDRYLGQINAISTVAAQDVRIVEV